MRVSRLILPAIAVALILSSGVASAAFSDVPTGHLYREAIDWLVGEGVVKGNPDGTYSPDRAVNRAEFLTMLYRAKGITPATVTAACYKDVPKDAWFSPVVCDASKKNYVAGYDGGWFKPEKEVNRVEALKMLIGVLGINTEPLTDANILLASYSDTSKSAWYMKFVVTAKAKGILPIAGWSSSKLEPEKALRRGEAAALIHQALKKADVQRASSSSASSVAEGRSSKSSAADLGNDPKVHGVSLPFTQVTNFPKKTPEVFRFNLDAAKVVKAKVVVDDGTVTCRLFKLIGEGIPTEYYLGHQTGKTCWLQVALEKGSYQVEIQPTVSDVRYDMHIGFESGDGNDGFSEAKLLTTAPKTSYLEVEDYADWYTFTVKEEKLMTVEVIGADTTCLVYPMADVDLYGFSGPLCNEAYLYPKGTYIVGVVRRGNKDEKQTYTVRYR